MSYSKGTIYRIVCLPNPNIQYIGSTFNLLKIRWNKHKQHYHEWIKYGRTTKQNISIYPYFDKYGIENFKMLIIKKYNVYREHNKDTKHLRVYEQLFINKTKNVNKIPAFQPLKKQRLKQYRETHKKEKQIMDKLYREKNKEQIRLSKQVKIKCICGSLYCKSDKGQHINSKKHQDYLKNPTKEIKSNQYKCECGCIVSSKPYNITRHKTSIKHKTYLNNI